LENGSNFAKWSHTSNRASNAFFEHVPSYDKALGWLSASFEKVGCNCLGGLIYAIPSLGSFAFFWEQRNLLARRSLASLKKGFWKQLPSSSDSSAAWSFRISL
jgi:hypothetical protein